MATDIMQPMRFTIDLASGLTQTPMRTQLMKGDRSANKIIVKLTDGRETADLTGVSATGSFIRPPDAAEILLPGSVQDDEASVELIDDCYAAEGYCQIDVMLTMSGITRTILSLTGYVLGKGSGAYVDVSGVIPNINDIVAQYAEMKRVTEETQAAANKANDAASRAPYVGANGNWFVWDAGSGAYVDSGSKAQGPEGPQGKPGTGFGTVTGVEVNGGIYTPDDTGVVRLPEMGGAGAEIDDENASRETTYSSEKIEQELTQLNQANEQQNETLAQLKENIGAVNLLDNSDFRNPVNSKGQTSYSEIGYTIDRWNTVASHIGVSVDSGFISISNSGSGRSSIEQRIDGSFVGKTLTFAVCDNNNSIHCVTASIKADTGEVQVFSMSDFDGHTIRLIMYKGGIVAVQAMIAVGATLKLKWAALYEGAYTAETLPPYRPKGDAVELAECQRYLPVAIITGEDEFKSIGAGAAISESEIKIVIPVPTSPRKTPIISCEGVSNLLLRGGSFLVPMAVSVDISSMNAVTIT